MSFLKKAYALEQEVVEDVVEPTGEEFAEVDAETETTRQEAEAMGEELDRAVAVHKELENQNDTVREILEQDGEITPATAAVLEVARRTAAAGLGLDPDEEGKELVDAAGLESLVATKSVVALEEAEKASKSLWEKIKALWAAFISKVGEFWNWLTKLLDFFSNKNKALANKLKAMDKESFEKALSVLNERLSEKIKESGNSRKAYDQHNRSDFAAFDKNGKIVDIESEVSKALSKLVIVNKKFDSLADQAKKVLSAPENEKAKQPGGKFLMENLLKGNFQEEQVDILNVTHVFNGFYNHVRYERYVTQAGMPFKITCAKDELVNILLKTDKICKEMRKYSEQAFKRYKLEQKMATDAIKETSDESDRIVHQLVLTSRKNIFKGESAVTRQITKVMSSYARITQEIINASGSAKKEEK